MTNVTVHMNKKTLFANCYYSRCRINRCYKGQSQKTNVSRYLQLQLHTSHSPKLKLLASVYYTIYCKIVCTAKKIKITNLWNQIL